MGQPVGLASTPRPERRERQTRVAPRTRALTRALRDQTPAVHVARRAQRRRRGPARRQAGGPARRAGRERHVHRRGEGARRAGTSTPARLPLAASTTPRAALIDGAAYIFGGGAVSSYDHVLRFDPRAAASLRWVRCRRRRPTWRSPRSAGAPTWSAATTASRRSTRCSPGGPGGPRGSSRACRSSLRYAAVAASGGRLIIAGGSHGEGAEDAILRFEPASGRVRPIGRLPGPSPTPRPWRSAPTCICSAGGAPPRSPDRGDPRDRSARRRGHERGRLPLALSDAAAGVVGGRIWLAGGQSGAGRRSRRSAQLTPRASP